MHDYSVCETCYSHNFGSTKESCQTCRAPFFSFGWRCFEYLENLPRLLPGGELGGNFYFGLIILTQVVGVGVELLLVHRLRRRDLLPKKDQIVIFTALGVEVVRMLLVDWVVLASYFAGQGWAVYRAPVEVSDAADFPAECQYR